jgi:hypothetical protein
MQNFRDVADVRDVLGDTYRSFAQGPRRHVVAADFLSLSPEEQLLRVVKQGWLMKGGTINKLVRPRHLPVFCRFGSAAVLASISRPGPFHSLTHSPTHSLTHSLTHALVVVEKALGGVHQQPVGHLVLREESLRQRRRRRTHLLRSHSGYGTSL